MGTISKAPPITTEQFLAFTAPPGFRDELIEGEIVLSPDPKPIHHDIAEQIYLLLLRSLPESLYKVGARVNIRLEQSNSMPSPDIFVLTRAAWTEARRKDAYPRSSPILAVEVISPANRKRRIDQKVNLYLENGSQAVWVVYPKRRELQAHTLRQTAPSVYRANEAVPLPAPLPILSLEINDIFKGGNDD